MQRLDRAVRNVEIVDLQVPNPVAKAGLTFLDTPGIGGFRGAYQSAIQTFLPVVDGMLFVTEADCVAKVTDLIREPTRAVEMGRAARAKAVQLFDPQRLSLRYAALLCGDRVELAVAPPSSAELELER